MKGCFGIVILVIGAAAVGAIVSYMSARVLFPDMGLGVPSYGKFFFVALLVSVVTTLAGFIKEMFE